MRGEQIAFPATMSENVFSSALGICAFTMNSWDNPTASGQFYKSVTPGAFALTVLIACIVTTACGGGGGGATSPPPSVPGSLTVNITGVSSGTAAAIIVTGPGGFSQTISQTTTLTSLSPGVYSFTAPILAPVSSSSLTVPTFSSNPVTVNSGATATSTIAYGSLALAWQAIGPRAIHIRNGIPAAGQVAAIAVNNSNPTTIYVGCGGFAGPPTSTGVYMTTDGGKTWSSSSSGLTDPAVTALWLDQNNPTTLVAGTVNTGLFRSTDAGATWQATASLGLTTALLQVGTSLYAGTGQGIAVSQDEGATWNLIAPTQVAVGSLSASGTYIYAGLDDGHVMVQSTPAGTWLTTQPLTNVIANSISADSANPQHAFVVEQGYYSIPDLYETQNGGASWTPVSSTVLNVPIQDVAFDPSDSSGKTVYAGADVWFGVSHDSGKTWTQLDAPNSNNPGAWWDERILLPQFAGVSGQVAVGADQGIYLSGDSGISWQSLNGDLTTSISYHSAVNGKTIILTMQDLGPVSSFDGGSTWDSAQSSNPAFLEGGTTLINPGNASYAYLYNGAGFQFSSDGGINYQISQVLTGAGFAGDHGNSQIIAVDPKSPSNVYAAAWNGNGVAEGIYQSTNYGLSWSRLNWPIHQPVLIAFDPTSNQNIFVGQADGNLQVSHDGGKTWTASMLGNVSTGNWPIAVAINPNLPNVVLVGMSGPPQQGGGVLHSFDGGRSFSPANLGLGNPQNPQPWPDYIFTLAYDPAGSGLVAAARWDGIYLSSDNGSHWVSARGNAVPIAFTSAMWTNGSIYTTTFGEGVVQLPVKIQLP